MTQSHTVTPLHLDDIRVAADRIGPYLHHTPLIHSSTLSNDLGAPTHLKLKYLQKTGSFKPRGALNKLLSMSPEDLQRGVVGGNHAQGLAFAARSKGSGPSPVSFKTFFTV